jgi:hypothetical protein
MASFLFRDDDGWPYPDPDVHAAIEIPDHALDIDDDIMCLRGPHPHLYDTLDPVERTVIAASFGLDGAATRTLDELGADTGLDAVALRAALESGLGKLRVELA